MVLTPLIGIIEIIKDRTGISEKIKRLTKMMIKTKMIKIRRVYYLEFSHLKIRETKMMIIMIIKRILKNQKLLSLIILNLKLFSLIIQNLKQRRIQMTVMMKENQTIHMMMFLMEILIMKRKMTMKMSILFTRIPTISQLNILRSTMFQ